MLTIAPNTLLLHNSIVAAVKNMYQEGKLNFPPTGNNIAQVAAHISICSRQGLSKLRDLKSDQLTLERSIKKALHVSPHVYTVADVIQQKTCNHL